MGNGLSHAFGEINWWKLSEESLTVHKKCNICVTFDSAISLLGMDSDRIVEQV